MGVPPDTELDAPTLDDATLRAGPPEPGAVTFVLPDTEPQSRPVELDVPPVASDDRGYAGRYELRAVLGVGGMGEVRLCRDARIGRDVALKVIRRGQGTRADSQARFEREARVQGQLEHPAVVPVYDLGVGPDGAAYFTMKRLRGKTLDQVIDALAMGDEDATAAYTRRRLLVAFTQVGLAVAFAHSRGVLHRDLKPSNVMLGDFGEVYVLDWGIAKVAGAPDLPAGDRDPSGAAPPDRVAPPTHDAQTLAGDVMGTPGYMAPEQIRGEHDRVDGRADVYALGAILYEILTLEPLHPRGGIDVVVSSTLDGADARASLRAPERDVPPELEAICVRATALEPGDRYTGARDLTDAVERFLDGDRDLERRRQMAEAHAAAALRASERARAGEGDVRAAAQEALREASAALALEPAHPTAMDTLVHVLVEGPTDMPPEARAEFEESNRSADRESRRATLYAYGLSNFCVFFALILGVRDWVAFGVAASLSFLAGGLALASARGRIAPFLVYCTGVAAITATSMFVGWSIVVPPMTAVHTAGAFLYGDKKLRGPALVLGLLPVLFPFVLAKLGWLPSSYTFEGGRMIVNPWMTELPPALTQLVLVVAGVSLVVAPSVVMGRIQDALSAAEERVFLHAWNLRRLLPEGARRATRVPRPRRRRP